MRNPFPNHLQKHYAIGLVEGGRRVLSCKNKEYTIEKGSMLLFNPGDNHVCVQNGSRNLDYQGLNIEEEVENVYAYMEQHFGFYENPSYNDSPMDTSIYMRLDL